MLLRHRGKLVLVRFIAEGGTSTITWGLEDLEASGAAGLEASVLTAAVLIQTETPF